MKSVITTANLPEAKRFAFWQDAICNRFMQLEFSRLSDRAFSGEIETAELDDVRFTRVCSRDHKLVRTSDRIRQSREETVVLGLQLSGTGVFSQDGREGTLAPGDFVLYDSVRPFSWSFSHDFTQLVLHMERELLARRIGQIERLTARPVRSDTPMGSLVSSFFRQLASMTARVEQPTAHRLSEISLALVTTALGELVAHQQDESQSWALLGHHGSSGGLFPQRNQPRKGELKMRLLKGKCATARRFMAFILVTFFAAGMALGQLGPLGPFVHFDIPLTFTVGSTVLSPGTYSFSFSNDLSRIIVVSGKSTVADLKIIARISGPNELFDGGYLVFDKTDSSLLLSEVWLTGMGGALVHPIPNGDSSLGLIGTSLNMKQSYSGKKVYDLTCFRCHGDNGKGNPEADKFFGLTIPRLDSAEVQKKSDAELRQQITQGSDVMPPVEIEESGFRHRLQPQDVDAVIAYLRTLKQ